MTVMETPQPDAGEPAVRPAGGQGTRRAAGSLAHAMAQVRRSQGAISPGDIADLRRLDPDDPSSPAFWKVLTSLVAPHVDLPAGGEPLDRAERKWATILNAAAHLRGLHRADRPLGAALADAGLSELRFVRLLRASGDALPAVVRITARYLAAKGEPADLADLAELVISDGHPSAERVRRRIARTYYQTNNEHGD